MRREPDEIDDEPRGPRREVDSRREVDADREKREDRQQALIARLRHEAALHVRDVAVLRERLEAVEHELVDLRAIRDALTPPELPQRPGLELAAAFLPAASELVSGDFYLVAEGPRDSTVLVVGDVVGHGVHAGRRAAFVRTAFAATAPFSDDPARLLSWANTALTERAGTGSEFVTAACVTFQPRERLVRWAYAGHPPALWLDDGREMVAPRQGTPLGVRADPGCVEGTRRATPGAGALLYTDGLTEARHEGALLGLDAVSAVLDGLHRPSPKEAVAALRGRAAAFAYGTLTDDICLLAARIT
jgi:serine phosphatase RsbU (regulator of sigma subunit)